MTEEISRSKKEKISFAKESIAKLRDKILAGATTNRNKLINFKQRPMKIFKNALDFIPFLAFTVPFIVILS